MKTVYVSFIEPQRGAKVMKDISEAEERDFNNKEHPTLIIQSEKAGIAKKY